MSSQRPPVFVLGLTLGDYLLWNWSLGGSHDALALVSGLTLPPLAVACLWLLALNLTRIIARSTKLPSRIVRSAAFPRRRARRPGRSRALARLSVRKHPPARAAATNITRGDPPSSNAPAGGRSSSKIAA